MEYPLATMRALLPLLLVTPLVAAIASAGPAASPGAEAERLLVRYLRIDTTNPPGRELAAARFLAEVLEGEGVPAEVLDLGGGRANLVARWKGTNPAASGVALLHHMDVVPADPARWRSPPFAARKIGHELYGRGAIDIKGKGVIDLVTFLGFVRRKERLPFDLVFLAVADEENGGRGSRAMLSEHRHHLAGVRTVIDEGMSVRVDEGGAPIAYLASVGEKTPLWLRVTFEGEAGHGSLPRRGTAPQRAVEAAARILRHPWPYDVRPAVLEQLRLYTAGRELSELPGWAGGLEPSLERTAFLRALSDDPEVGALLRSTISLTRLEGSDKINTIPNRASFGLDCRLLPGVSAADFQAELREVIRDPGAIFEVLYTQDGPPASPTDTPFWRALRAAAEARDPGVPVVPALLTASTDAAFYRAAGFVTYGFEPYALTKEEYEQSHTNDERLDVRKLGPAIDLLTDILRRTRGGDG